MSKIKYESAKLSKLRAKFNDRIFAIPQIQRRFVWKKTQVCDLMDSIYRHIPIGVFLTWRTEGIRVADLRPHSNSIIKTYSYRNRFADIIIDGQQRLSSIYGILNGTTPQDEENSEVDFSKIYFDTSTSKIDENKFFYAGSMNGSDSDYIQLTELLGSPPSAIKKRYQLNQAKFRQVKKCHQMFHSYKFYSLIIESNDSKEIEQTFIRINSKGTPAKRADILFARTAKVALRDRVEEARRGLKYGFKYLKNDTLNSTIALVDGETRIGKAALEAFVKRFNKRKIKKTEFKKEWKKYSNAFALANDFLSDKLNITILDLLPSENIFAMLSFFFYYKGKGRANNAQLRELKKWFWHTAIGERYSGANFNRNIPDDVRFMQKLAKGRKVPYKIKEKIEPTEFLKKDYRSRRSAAVRGFYLLLKNKKPRYLDNGQAMQMEEFASISNRRDRHHIFAKALFNRYPSKWQNSIANICFLAADNNQSVGGNYPADYLLKYRKRPNFSIILKSHIIPNCNGLWRKSLKEGFKEFINIRATTITSEIEKLAGLKRGALFLKFDGIKRI